MLARLRLARARRGRRTGCDAGFRCAALWPYLDAMKTKPLAFSVHLLTGSGAALALMALVAATRASGG